MRKHLKNVGNARTVASSPLIMGRTFLYFFISLPLHSLIRFPACPCSCAPVFLLCSLFHVFLYFLFSYFLFSYLMFPPPILVFPSFSVFTPLARPFFASLFPSFDIRPLCFPSFVLSFKVRFQRRMVQGEMVLNLPLPTTLQLPRRHHRVTATFLITPLHHYIIMKTTSPPPRRNFNGV